MARPRKNAGQGSALSGGQASYVLDRMVKERRISPGEINRYVSEMSQEISQLEQRLAGLRAAAGHGVAAVAGAAAAVAGAVVRRRRRRGPGRPAGKRGPGRPPGKRGPGRPPGKRGPGRPPTSAAPAAKAAPAKRRRRSAITPEQLASRQLQGRYLALVRQFSANKRPAFAKTAKEKGREAAIKEMQESLKK